MSENTFQGDGIPEPATINDRFRGQSFQHQPPPDLYAMASPGNAPGRVAKRREEHTNKMDWIEVFILLYTAGHNLFNAFERAQESWLMFLFIAGGVLSMEWYLFQGQKAVKNGEYTTRQKRVFRGWGSLFFFFIILGVLTASQAVDGIANVFVEFHYHWILPLGTVLLLPALWHLRSADEILQADNEAANLELLSMAEEKRALHSDKYMDLMKRRDERVHVWNLRNMLGDKIDTLIQGTFRNSNTKKQIEIKAKEEVPLLLEKAGITDKPERSVKG